VADNSSLDVTRFSYPINTTSGGALPWYGNVNVSWQTTSSSASYCTAAVALAQK